MASMQPPESVAVASRRYQSTQASVGDTRELARDMFKLIDADASGEITVHEMHAVVSDLLGLDLSVEDVFNVVQDIDEDGNGELDLEEFEVALRGAECGGGVLVGPGVDHRAERLCIVDAEPRLLFWLLPQDS